MEQFNLIKVNSGKLAQQVENLANEIWREHYSNILDPGQIEYMLNKFQTQEVILAGDTDYYLMMNGEIPVGYFGIRAEQNSLFLSKLYLKREYRGRGLAHRALEYIEELSSKQGLKKIWLTVNIHNASSIAAYEKMGFSIARNQKADIGNGYVMDDHIMEKEVK